MSYFCNYSVASFMTITLHKIENKYNWECNRGGEKSAAGVFCIGAAPLAFEIGAPKKE